MFEKIDQLAYTYASVRNKICKKSEKAKDRDPWLFQRLVELIEVVPGEFVNKLLMFLGELFLYSLFVRLSMFEKIDPIKIYDFILRALRFRRLY
jgi:hypothetical protein